MESEARMAARSSARRARAPGLWTAGVLALLLVIVSAAAGAFAARKAADDALAERAGSARQAFSQALAERPDPRAAVRVTERRLRGTGVRLRVGPTPPDADGKDFSYRIRGRGQSRLWVVVPDASLGDATRTGALTGGIAGLVLALLAFLLLPRARESGQGAPPSQMAQAIQRLVSGDTEARLPETGRGREVAHAFNRLAARVEELQTQATTDPLTGLSNRRHFEQELEVELKRAKRTSKPVALMVLDFDGFKEINDAQGHPFGDQILRSAAEALLETVRATDVLARVGGDEFAFILPETDATRAEIVAERARAAMRTAQPSGFELTCCAGIASYPRDAQDTQTLLACADGSLYWAKHSGRGQTRVFDPGHVTVARGEGERSEVLALLKNDDSITPVFQPIVSLATARISGFEALSRFAQPPERRPDEWFAIAQRSGLGFELEALAIRKALETPGRPAGTYLSLNMSPSSVSAPQVLDVLPDDLSEIVIEITEHELFADEEGLRAGLAPLRERGARIAVDDAGAGYAGLQQLMRVQPDIIKLDRALVANVHEDPAKGALIDSFVRFARRTGAVVCAEGIEELDELRALADLDVTYGQGYGLAKPSPPWVNVSAWVADTLRRTRLASSATLSLDQADFSDQRLALVSQALAKVTTLEELTALRELIAAEINADEVALLRMQTGEALVPLLDGFWLPDGEAMRLVNYEHARMALETEEPTQLLVSDPGGGLGELALLGRSGFHAVLMIPVCAHGRQVGMMLALSRTERPWTRTERNRARVIGYQLAPALETVAPSVPDAPPQTSDV